MSKANRRRQRPGNQSSTNRPGGSQAAGQPAPSAGTGGPTSSGAGVPPAAGPSVGAGSGAAGTSPRPGTPRPAGTGARPTSTSARHGRRERQRATYKPSFMERYRTALVLGVVVLAVALLSVFVFLSASQPAYACSTIFMPTPTASPSPGATPNLGYVQPDQGNSHVSRGDKVTYTYCAPASGSHYFASGAGPIAARVYGPNDSVVPQGWIHNLEHGGLVILYQGTSAGATPEGQAQMKAFYEAFPPAQNCGPVIARFDQMSSPFQAILWGRVLPLQTFDEATITAFWEQWGGRTNPEKNAGCPTPNQSSAPTVSSAPSAAPSSSAAPSVAPTPAPSVAAPAAPSVAAPSPS